MIKICTSTVCFKEGGSPSNWTVVDRGGGGGGGDGVKKFALFCGRHQWMTAISNPFVIVCNIQIVI